MKDNKLTTVLIAMVGVLLLLNLIQGFGESKKVSAESGPEKIGRYQIAAWAAQAGSRIHHNGYYIIDTVTGKITDSRAEVHSDEGGEPVHHREK